MHVCSIVLWWAFWENHQSNFNQCRHYWNSWSWKTIFRNYFVRKLLEYYLRKQANFSIALDKLPGALTIPVLCGTFDSNGDMSWSAWEYDRKAYLSFSKTQKSELYDKGCTNFQPKFIISYFWWYNSELSHQVWRRCRSSLLLSKVSLSFPIGL